MSPLAKSMHQKSLNDQISNHENSPTDLRLKRLSDKILPESPYILTVPTTYRVSSHQANDWRRGSPFGADEERLQYLSFISHAWDDTMLNAVGDWDDGQGGIADKSSQNSSKTNSWTGSPLPGQPLRKIISLEAYKNKTAAQAGAKLSPGENGENKVQEKVNAPVLPPVKEVKPVKEDRPQSQKRPIEAVTQDEVAKVPDPSAAPPPAKKARTSPEPPNSEPKVPPPKQNIRVRKLPPLLSPTLPPSVEEELARRKKAASAVPKVKNVGTASTLVPPIASHAFASKISSKDSNTLSNKQGNNPVSKNRNKMSPNSNSLPSQQKPRASAPDHGDKTVKPNGVTSARPLANGVAAKSKEESTASPALKSGMDKLERKSLMVKLKIPKSARKNWVRIINMRVGPRKLDQSLAPQTQGLQRNRSRDQPEGKNEPDISKSGEKRRRAEEKEEEPSSKRPKVASSTLTAQKNNGPTRPAGKSPALPSNHSTQRPPTSTSIKPAIRSPALSQHGSAQRQQTTTTPKHNLKSTAMHRITSAEGNVQTPSEGIRSGTPTAPGSAERSSRDARATSSTSSTTFVTDKSGDVGMWKGENQKYTALGRTLKHAADEKLKDPQLKDPNGSNNTVIKNQGIAIAIETVLCYMLAFLAADEMQGGRKAGDPGTWRSLLGYLNFVIGQAEPIPHLHGLCLQLEAVCRDTILLCDHERLERDPTLAAGSDEARPSAPNREAGTAAAERERVARAAAYAEFRKDLVKNAQSSQQAWLTGYSRLSTDDLSQSYPNTWAKRTKVPGAAKGKERLVFGKYGDGGFYLPLNQTSSGLEAVRMGLSFLEEWCKMEKVQWRAKLVL